MLSDKIQGDAELPERKDECIRLHANENPLGMSEQVQNQCMSDLSLMNQYPDPTYRSLRSAIGHRWDVEPEQLIIGNGSDELIDIALRSLLKPDSRITALRHSFMMYEKRARLLGAIYSEIPVDNNGQVTSNDIKETTNNQTDILVLVNPSNPLANYIEPSYLLSLVEEIPLITTVIIDEAYAEFTPDRENTAGLQIVRNRINSVCLRTFSKAYGLAGLRLGWAYVSADILPKLETRRAPYNVSALSSLAGEYALQDTEHLNRTTEYCWTWGKRLVDLFDAFGIKARSEYVNFVFVEFGNDTSCQEIHNALEREGFLTSRLTDYSLKNCLRISFGTPTQMEKLFSVLQRELIDRYLLE